MKGVHAVLQGSAFTIIHSQQEGKLAAHREEWATSVEPEDTKGSEDSRFLNALTPMSPFQFQGSALDQLTS